MTRIFRKVYMAIIGLLMVATSQVSGANCQQSNCCEQSCWRFFDCELNFRGEILYLRPELCGLESAFGDTTISTSVDEDAVTTTSVIESDKEPHSVWNTGYRLGANILFNCFDVELDWMRFHGSAKFSEGTQHGRWKIRYDAIDWTFGRHFCVASCFRLKPYIGVRGIEIHQKLTSHLETLFTSPLIGDNIVFTDKNDKESFRGIGPQIGLNVDWYLGCNFSLYGDFAVVSYYGSVHGENFDTDTFTSTVSICDGKKKHCFNNIGTDIALGIRWDTCVNCFCGCDITLMAKLGAEQHRIYDFSKLGSDGTLSLDGGIFAIGIGFAY